MKKLLIMILTAIAVQCRAVPQLISYQGYLTNPDGSPLDTTVAMVFKLYTDSTAGTLLWTEMRPAVSVADGNFYVRLGQIIPIPDAILSLVQVWLGVTAGNDTEMTPRNRLVSVPYSYRVGTVDGASGGTLSGKLNVGSGNTNAGEFAMVAGVNNQAPGYRAVVSGGQDNIAADAWCTVAGGMANTASAGSAFVGGGVDNSASESFAAVGGGYDNVASDSFATVPGGHHNAANGPATTISGGEYNLADSIGATIGGGRDNQALADYSTVAGGQANAARGVHSIVTGGISNQATGPYSSVCGGWANQASGDRSFTGGGRDNVSSGYASAISGGSGNIAAGNLSLIGGGRDNQALADYSTVAGGQANAARGVHSIVTGGISNQATGPYSSVCGGWANQASGDRSFTGGGRDNVSSGYASAISGGSGNIAAGNYSFANGRRAKANNQGCFVWGDATDTDVVADNDNRWVARASGGVYFYTNSGMTTGSYLAAGSGTWSSVSDSTKKHRYGKVNTKEVLDKVAALPIERWSYKTQDESIHHIGPMAQDFWRLFHIGDDSLSISTIDPDGVALAAIQELAKRNEKLEEEIALLRFQVQTLLAKDQQSSLSKEK